MDHLSSQEFQIGMTYSRCCGVKEFHNIYAYTDAKRCMHAMLRHYFYKDTDDIIALGRKIYGSYCHSVVWKEQDLNRSAHILWMGLDNWKKMYKAPTHTMLRDLVKEQKLGSVWESGTGINGNTQNPIIVYVWSPDWDNAKLWWEANVSPEFFVQKRTEKIKNAFGNNDADWMTRRGYMSVKDLTDEEKVKAKELGFLL